MTTWERVRDLLVVLGIVLAAWQVFETKKSIETSNASLTLLVMDQYFTARNNMEKAMDTSDGLNAHRRAIGYYVAVAQGLCDLVGKGVLDEKFSNRLRNDVEDFRRNQHHNSNYREYITEALQGCYPDCCKKSGN